MFGRLGGFQKVAGHYADKMASGSGEQSGPLGEKRIGEMSVVVVEDFSRTTTTTTRTTTTWGWGWGWVMMLGKRRFPREVSFDVKKVGR
jgi:hypothetical protein